MVWVIVLLCLGITACCFDCLGGYTFNSVGLILHVVLMIVVFIDYLFDFDLLLCWLV